MSGELHSDFNKKRKRPSWKDDKHADKYYDSGDISAIRSNTTISDSVLKPGELPQASKTRLPDKDNKSADKYYANNEIKTKAKPVNKPRNTQELIVNNPNEINGILNEAINRLESNSSVVIYIQKDNTTLLHRVRTALELLVTREVISEDKYRSIKLSYTNNLDTIFGTPKPSGEKPVEDIVTIDPADFLSGKVTLEEEKIVTSPLVTTEVDLSSEEDNDFLAKHEVAITETKDTENFSKLSNDIIAKESMTGIGSTPKKPGKRHGRGSK